MKKILDLSSIYTLSFADDAEENNITGRILLDKDNNFEGVVVNDLNKTNYLVFGYLDKNKIDFIMGNDELDEVPKRFLSIHENDSYNGTVSAKDIFTEVPLGSCIIKKRDAEKTREVTGYEESVIEKNIEILKTNLGERTKELYDNFKENKTNKTGQIK